MTEEEKQSIIKFFGTVHAQAKQTDQAIIGNSKDLKPISSTIKNELEHVLQNPQRTVKTLPSTQNYTELMDNTTNTVQNYIPKQHVDNVSPVHINNDICKILECINSNLEKIASTLMSHYNGSKKVKNTKQV